MRATRVLVVDDDPNTADWLRLYLERDGHVVDVVGDGDAALAHADAHAPDLVLLDVMLPGLNGVDVCRALRSGAAVPIILITARTAEDDRLSGFAAGADDYVIKPFSPREVVARVRAVLRRARPADDAGTPITVAALTLRPDTLVAASGSAHVKLTPVEARLLGLLMRHPERGWTRTQLVDRVLGRDYDGSARTIDAHVKNLRRKLDTLSLGASGPRIETTHGLGYRLTCEA